MALSNNTRSAPTLPIISYGLGLLLVLLGERVFGTRPAVEYSLLVLATLALGLSTALRLVAKNATSSENVRIEAWLGWLTLGTVAALALAVLTQHQPTWFGIRPDLPSDVRDRRAGVLHIMWVAGLIGTVLPLVFAEAALSPMRKAARPEVSRVRSAAVAGLTLAIVALYGALFVYSASKVGVAADYSYFKTAKPSESTRRMVRGLKDNLRVVGLFPSVSEVRREVEHYVVDLARGSQKLQVEFHDRLLEPKVSRELRASQDGSLVLVRGELRQLINVGVDQKTARSVLRNLDQEFQKNLLKISRDAKVVYLTTGHGELNERKGPEVSSSGQGVQILRKLLEGQNFKLQDLGSAQGLSREIPKDADAVIVLGPTEPWALEELAALDAYARRGGHMLLALDVDARSVDIPREHTAGALPSSVTKPATKAGDISAKVEAAVHNIQTTGIGANVDEIARVVGVAFEPGTLANDRVYVQRRYDKSDYTQLVASRFSSHAAVSTLNRGNGNILLFGAGALKKIDSNDSGITFIVHAPPGTYVDQNGDFEIDGAESRGNFELVAAISRPASAARSKPEPQNAAQDKGAHDMRAIVMGDADAFTDLLLMNSTANRVLLVDALRWLVGEESFAGEISSEEDVRIAHTKEKDVFWFYSTILGAPVLVLMLGLLVVRRNRISGGRT